jgi:hypothetical protein
MRAIVDTSVVRVIGLLSVLWLLSSILPVIAQEGPTSSTNTSEILLQLSLSRVGEEERLTIRFINLGQGPISMPKPTEFCGDSLDGFVMVYRKVLRPGEDDDSGTGCTYDRVAREDILAEAAKWVTIAHGAPHDITVPLLKAVSLSPGGKYEIYARYYPPHLKDVELSTLVANGIYPVQVIVNSAPIILERSKALPGLAPEISPP